MWPFVHPLDIRWITETIQDILWLLRYPKMTFVRYEVSVLCEHLLPKSGKKLAMENVLNKI